ncbi:NACHT domain-containing protein [Streptosporangium sp. CA-135522]|uniref:NACHT domain-containing protein n=1 Tax=Streptosporangium sp. CA-135522 TaxID=3240072 RepID=UPI003D89C471
MLDISTIVATVVGVITLANWLLWVSPRWLGRRPGGPSSGPTSAEVDKAKDVLAGLVTEQWSNETTSWSLTDPEPIQVPWRLTEHEELMDHPHLVGGKAPALACLSGCATDLVDVFRTLRYRRLVVLGGPGAGKTTLAAQLLLELTRTRRPEDPIPVLLSAARWDTKTHPWLQDWLTACVDMDYPALRAEGLAPDIPRTLAARSEVLPVLDGLDELPAAARRDILRALNQSMRESDQLILTCRTEQFGESVEAAGDVITAAAVIEPCGLSAATAADYLEECLPPHPPITWTLVLDAMRASALPALAEVTSTPLGLWQVRVIYVASGNDPEPLLTLGRGDPFVLRAHLYDQLIPALISSRPPVGNPSQLFRPHHFWKPEHVRQWLTYLSLQEMPDGQDRDRKGAGGEEAHYVAWWYLARQTPTRLILWAAVVCGLAVGILIGSLTVPVAGVVIGLASAFVARFTIKSWFEEPPGYADFQLRGRVLLLVHCLKDGVIVGLLGALVGWLMSGTVGDAEISAALQVGLLSGIGFEFAIGLLRWVELPAPTTAARSPRSTWQADRNLNLIRMFSGLVIGLLGGYVAAKAGLDPVAALVSGLLFGLLFGLMLGSHHAWLAYSLTVPRLYAGGRLPLRTMAFLEDAYRLGLLRTEGPLYQFRNAELQKYLSQQPRS